jgi:hypothetical protein
MNDLTPSPARLQPRRALLAAAVALLASSCGTSHKRTVDRACYDDLRIFASQQEKIDQAAGLSPAPGTMTPAQVAAGIKAVEESVKACSSHLLPNERDGGRIVFDLLVAGNGKIAKACATETQYDNEEFNSCALRAIRKASFSRPAKSAWATVRYPFKFE